MALTLLGGLLGAFRLALSLGQPFPGLVMLWRKEYKLFTVSWVTPPNWTGLAAGMRINDRILCINGYRPVLEPKAYSLAPRDAGQSCPNGEKKYGDIFRETFISAEPTIDFFVDRNEEMLSIQGVPVIRFTLGLLLETFLPAFLLGLALLFVGWVVYRAHPDAEINLVFSLVMVVTSSFAFNNTLAGNITDVQFETGKITLVQIIPWVALLGPLTFHLTDLLTSAGPCSAAACRIRKPYYLLAIPICLAGVFAFTFNDLPASQPLTWAYIYWITLSWAFSGIWSLVSLSLTFRRAPVRWVRMQTGLVLAALGITTLASVPFLGLYYANQLTFPYMQGLPYLGLVVVGIFAYAILRYQLFAARTQTLTFLLVLVVSVFTALIVYIPVAREIGFIPILATALLTGSMFEGRLKRFQPSSWLEHLLHRERLDYQVVNRFNQHIYPLQSPESLAEVATGALKAELEAERVDLWLCCLDRPVLERYTEGCLAETLALAPSLAAQLVEVPGPVYATSQAGQAFALGLPGVAIVQPNGLWAPLANREQAIGLVYLGPRWTGDVFDEADLRLVSLLAAQLALAIANARQVERLQAMQRMILQAEENERHKIARELHDTVLQFLLVLTFGLDSMKGSPPELGDRIEVWQGRISVEASRLRDLLSYLRTPETLEQRGLVASLNQLFDEMRRQTTTRLECNLDPQAEPVLSTEAKVALYRMLREAVHNALKHAHAQQIALKLNLEGKRVVFSVRDDGQGFDIAVALKSIEKGYSSLQDMRIYIESIGGRLEVSSTIGRGTMIQGWAPTMMASSLLEPYQNEMK